MWKKVREREEFFLSWKCRSWSARLFGLLIWVVSVKKQRYSSFKQTNHRHFFTFTTQMFLFLLKTTNTIFSLDLCLLEFQRCKKYLKKKEKLFGLKEFEKERSRKPQSFGTWLSVFFLKARKLYKELKFS